MPTTTEALVVKEAGAPFELRRVELQDPAEDEVLVEIVATGICHTDVSLQKGLIPSPYPTILGHEGAGKVVKVGSAVRSVQPGDSVLLSYATCAKCPGCKVNKPFICPKWEAMNFGRLRGSEELGNTPTVKDEEMGSEIHGSLFGQSSMARMALCAESSCVKVPPETDLRALAPLGCGLMTGFGAVHHRLQPSTDSSLAVFGLGAVGMSAVLGAAYHRVQTIIAIDFIQSRLDLAQEFGATHCVNLTGLSEEEALEAIRAPTGLGSAGPDYAVEASGNMKAWKMAWEAIRPCGHMTTCGSPGPGVTPPIKVHETICVGKIWSAVLMGCGAPRETIPLLIDLHKQGKFPVEKLSKQYDVKDVDEALHDMHTGDVIKPIIVFQ